MSIKLGLVAIALSLGLSVPNLGSVFDDRALIVQTGPVQMIVAAQPFPVTLSADQTCLLEGCPVLSFDLSSTPFQGSPQETRRVERLDGVDLYRVGFTTQSGDQALGEQGRMSETPSAQSGEAQDAPITR